MAVHLPDESRSIALAAARAAFPLSVISEHPSLQEAEAAGADGTATLLIIGVNSPDLIPATAAATGAGEPKWVVVALGDPTTPSAESIPPAEWTVPTLARSFRQAVLQHELRCENLRLAGDLKTVARRVSHDLRSPIGCVHTSADVLLELSPDDAETVSSMAEIIKQSSGEIAQLVDRLRFVLLATVEPPEPGRVDMLAIVARVLRALEKPLEESKATISQPAAWPAARGVASWLEVIWTNLLENILRHAGPAPKIILEWKLRPEGLRFSITDTGPGVGATRLDGLFSRFDQLHSMRVAGLGLSIVQRLVELQGGSCGHEKPSTGGACFYFTLPSAE